MVESNSEITKPIGGYFELELPLHPELHAEAIALNSGRFCFEYLLRCHKYKKGVCAIFHLRHSNRSNHQIWHCV